GHHAVGEDVHDRLPPALDHAIRAANHGQLTADHAGCEYGRKRLAGPGARPVPDPLPLPNPHGEVPLHEIRSLRFAVYMESVASQNGEGLRLAVFVKKP